MITAYIDFWRNYVNFRGVATRSDFWYVIFIRFLLGMVILVIGLRIGYDGAKWVLPLLGIYKIIQIIPTISLTIRRLRDAGFHWAFYFVHCIPIVGLIILLGFACFPSKDYSGF